MRLYDRVARVTCWEPPKAVASTGNYFSTATVDATVIRDMRIQFSIEKTGRSEPNKCELTITNLKQETRNVLSKRPLVVKLEAGYRDTTFRHVFTGDVRKALPPERSGTEVDLKLQLGDGDRAYRHARYTRSYRGGVKIMDVVRDVAKAMGLGISDSAALFAVRELSVKQLADGMSVSGFARDELTRLLAPYGFSWSIQSGQLQILRDTDVREDRAWVIRAGNDGNGMIGSPVWSTADSGKSRTLTVECLLYPEIQPGGKVQIFSEDVRGGTFRVLKVGHVGDTHGSDWTTTVECKPL